MSRCLDVEDWEASVGHSPLGIGHWAMGSGHRAFGKWALGIAHCSMDIEHWAFGSKHSASNIGNETRGMGLWALGIVRWALGVKHTPRPFISHCCFFFLKKKAFELTKAIDVARARLLCLRSCFISIHGPCAYRIHGPFNDWHNWFSIELLIFY